MSTSKTWRVAMIGAGFIIQRGHVPAFQRLPNAEVVAICDVNEERARTFAQQAGIGGVFTDYREMLAEHLGTIPYEILTLPGDTWSRVAI